MKTIKNNKTKYDAGAEDGRIIFKKSYFIMIFFSEILICHISA